MANIHGFSGTGENPRRLPPVRRDDDGPGMLSGFSEPVLVEQLKIADEKRILFISGRQQVKDPKE